MLSTWFTMDDETIQTVELESPRSTSGRGRRRFLAKS